MRQRNWFHVVGFALWGAWLVAGLLFVRADAGLYWGAPFWLLLLLVGGSVLLSNALRRRPGSRRPPPFPPVGRRDVP